MSIKVRIKLDDGVALPKYQTSGAAAIDLTANIEKTLTLRPGEVAKIPTGIRLDMTDTGNICGLVLPRSGLGTKGFALANTVGLIDNDYQGEIIVMARNINASLRAGMGETAGQNLVIEPGMRIAQLMFTGALQVDLEEVDAFEVETERGEGGFGSTGA